MFNEIRNLHNSIRTVENLKSSMIEHKGNDFIANPTPEKASEINAFFSDTAFAFDVKARIDRSGVSFRAYEKGKDGFADTSVLYLSGFDKGNFTDVINKRLDKLHAKLDKAINELENCINADK